MPKGEYDNVASFADVDFRLTKIYTLANALGEWIVEPKPPTFTNESLANPLASFVLDPLTGAELSPTAEALAAAMREPKKEESKKDVPPHCLWLAVSKKSMRMAVNFNGDRVAKVEFEAEELAEAFYLTRHGTSARARGILVAENRSKGAGWNNHHGNCNVLFTTFLGVHHPCRSVLRAYTVSLATDAGRIRLTALLQTAEEPH